jgi:4-hydroxy-tetrahydrodipicolinate reductase
MRIALAGCTGRMSLEIIKEILKDSSNILVGALASENNPMLGSNVGELVNKKLDVKISSDIEHFLQDADVIIDFSAPDLTLKLAVLAQKYDKALVSGTTGLNSQQKLELEELAKKTRMVWAPNMSIGVNLIYALVHKAASNLDENFDTEIIEFHHRNKKDAPSGTSLAMGEYISSAQKSALKERAVFNRSVPPGATRRQGEIGFSSIRAGDIIGDHKAIFAADGERIEISHHASSRNIYAKGAIRAASWLTKQMPGKLYNMLDVLGLGLL